MSRVVLITGSTRGIGLATAKEFLRAGDRVVIFCRHEDHVKEAANELSKTAPEENILALKGDVRIPADVTRIVQQTIEHFGTIDVLVNNAGIAHFKNIEETDIEIWDDTIDTNLRGYFLFLKETIPHMVRQGNGVLINISSGLGLYGSAKYSAYCASKFGIIGLVEVLADELKRTPIKIYAVCPGGVNTKLHLDMHPGENPDKMIQPEHIGKKIFELAKGKKRSGTIIKVYK